MNLHIKATEKSFYIYVIKLLVIYFLLDYGTTFFIGITSKGDIYIEWLDKYFNYVKWLRYSLLFGAKQIVNLLGYHSYVVGLYIIRIKNGAAVQLVYTCLGYGVMSFWIAFIMANKVQLKYKLKWLFAGLFVIYLSNVARICVLLIAAQNKWNLPFNIEHHSFYNFIAYTVIIIMMLLFFKQLQKLKANNTV